MTNPIRHESDLIPDQLVPPETLRETIQEASRLFDDLTDDDGSIDPFFGLVDFKECECDYRLTIELPRNMFREVTVQYQEGKLALGGRRLGGAAVDRRFDFLEDGFQREIPLPLDVQHTSIEVIHDDDAIRITIPKADVGGTQRP